jgi:AsmA protein
MSRRIVAAAVLAAFLVLGIAAAPWTISSARLQQTVARQLRATYGLDLEVEGRGTIALLPAPRVKFNDISLSAGGTQIASGGQLRGELRLWPLLAARLEISGVALTGTRIEIEHDEKGGSAWDDLAARLRAHAEGSEQRPHLRRLTLIRSDLAYKDRQSGAETEVKGINLVINWPSRDQPASMSGSLVWRGEPLDVSVGGIEPKALFAGQKSPITLAVKGARSRLNIVGETSVAPDPRLSGTMAFETASLRDAMEWGGIDFPLGRTIQAFRLDGPFSIDPHEASWPSVRLVVGKDSVDGAISAQFDGEQPSIRATLAGTAIDLTQLFEPLGDYRSADGFWLTDPFPPRITGGGSIDVRLSAASAKLGSARLEDVAAALMLTPGRFEFSLGRASLRDGVVKGKVTVTAADGPYELKAQGSFDRLELSALLAEIGQSRWLAGAAQGQFTMEGAGDSPAELVRQLNGRASLTAQSVELSGVSLDTVLRRAERRPLSMPLDWRGGRTPFEQGQINVVLSKGVAEVANSALTSPSLRTSLRGRLSLLERTIAFRAVTEGREALDGTPSLVFDIIGPWDDLSIRPNVDALIQRSGAARPLLPNRQP